MVAIAQETKPLSFEDALTTRDFVRGSLIRFSPDGKSLALALRDNRRATTDDPLRYYRTGVKAVAVGADIYILDVKTGKVRNATGGNGNSASWSPTWSPDGRFLAFLSDRDGSGQARLWIMEVATGKTRKASDVKARANEIQWLPNSREVLLTVVSEGFTPEEFADRVMGNTVNK